MIKATVYVQLKKGVLDPQGAAVQGGLNTMGYDEVKEVQVGKRLILQLDTDKATAEKRVEEMCRRLLSNPVIEEFTFELEEA